MEDTLQARGRHQVRSFRYGIVALALCAAVAGAPAPGVAWADSHAVNSTTNAATQTGPADRPAAEPAAGKQDQAESQTPARREADPDPDAGSDTGESFDMAEPEADGRGPKRNHSADVTAEKVASQSDSSTEGDATPPTRTARDKSSAGRPLLRIVRELAEERRAAAPTPAAKPVTVEAPSPRRAHPAAPEQADAAAPALTVVTPLTTPQTAVAPEPLSPLAKLLQLPGRLVNTVLQFFDMTASANGPKSPISIAPINNLFFAAFREVERWFDLDRPPPPQPPVPTLTYTGSTTTLTPTVAQFLNAAATAYVLGGTAGGLVPFTVNGFQMSAVNILSGHAAKTWVTPEGQIIIAYSGTTGGTNLLFNPFIAISQILADLQVVFTKKTPHAFDDALEFALRVQAAAAAQGYDVDDIFVTGHSLGGWEAEYVAQQIGLAGIAFESPGINTTVPGNGADAMFVNIETYGDPAGFMATDLPGLQPFMPPYVPGGGTKPHYGSIVMIGDPAAMTPLLNAVTLWRKGPIRNLIFLADFLGNFFQYHLPAVQAYHLGVTLDPAVVPWMGTARGPVHTGYGDMTIPQLLKAASDAGNLQRSAVAA